MAQVSYGTITITDTNDINRIYVEYCRSTSNQLSGTTVPNITRAWGETTPQWVDGQYIWQRAVIEQSGTLEKTYGTPVCITGAQGETGDQGPQGPQGGTGAAGRSLTSTTTQYTTAAANITITQNNMSSYTWSSNVPTYNANTPAYWVRITNVYSNPSSTEYIIYKDNGITDAVKTSNDANTTAASANSTANAANQTANTANNTANNANAKADQAVTNVNNLQTKLKYYWVNEVSHTNGVSGWTKPNYPVGTYAASGISGTTFDSENSSTYGYNTWYANGINLRYNAINLGQLTGTSLIFYHPSTSSQGGKAMELTGSALKFYDATGAVAQATFGGTQATISGTINVYDGKIGNNANNYWYIGNYTDYNQNNSAIIKSKGTASIQLDETNTWRISTNRIHTAWAPETGDDAFLLHYPKFNDSSSNNKYWDYGLHLPASNSDKFLYIRNASGSETLDNLLNDLDDYGYNYWTYKFYIDGEGNIHAGDIYSHDTLISGTSAPYLLKSGGTITGALEVNGALTKSGKTVTYLTSTPVSGQILVADGTSGGIKTSGYTIAKSVPSDAVFTDKNVQTSQANTTKIFLAGTSTSGTSTGTLSYDSNVYLTTTAGVLHATTFEGNLSGTATKANQDGDGNVIKTTYLKLSGGNVTGPVTFGDSVLADEIITGSLIVNGDARFANTINGSISGSATSATKDGNGNIISSTYMKLSGTNTNSATNTFSGVNTFSNSVTFSNKFFNYSGIEVGTTDTARVVWFADAAYAGKPCYDNDFKYNPATNVLTVGSITGSAASATKATQDGSGNIITSYYTPISTAVTNVAYDSTNNKITKTINGLTTEVVTVATIKSAIGSLKNPNALKVRVYSGTSTPTDTSYDGSTANQSVEVAGKSAITGVAAAPKTSSSDVTTFTLTKADGSTSTFDISIIASAATGATMLKDSNGAISKGDATTPVFFSGGVPSLASKYAGGTAVTLNGSSKAASTASFYAPTGGGTANQVLISKGNAAPEWTNQSNLSVGSASKLNNLTLNNTTLHNTAGTFAFSGSGLPWDGTDWVGLQVDSGVDKFQIHVRDGNVLEFRQNDSGGTDSANWGEWQQCLSSGNYTSYTVKKDGTGASGTWGIDISGNSATTTKLKTAVNITVGDKSNSFDGSGAISFTKD